MLIVLALILVLCIVVVNFTINPTVKYDIGLVMCCYNRPEYLKKTLSSLKSSLEGMRVKMLVLIHNDGSTDPSIDGLIRDWNVESNMVDIIKTSSPINRGIHASLITSLTRVIDVCNYITILDSDAIVKNNWLTSLWNTYHLGSSYFAKSPIVVSGFNCAKAHPVIGYIRNGSVPVAVLKKSVGGINLYSSADFFRHYVMRAIQQCKCKNQGWDWEMCKIMNQHGGKILSTYPSVVQHIGIDGVNSSGATYDIAEDFYQ